MAASSSSSPMQAYVEPSDWLKSIVQDDGSCAVDAVSSPSSELLQCIPAPPALQAVERRLRPQHEQALKCPRCDSTHTKFCYYNNYSLSQPRYFCKTCRRYWTKGGSLRNVPVGGGCRKNKRSSSAAAAAASKIIKSSASEQALGSVSSLPPLLTSYNHEADTDLHLSFPPGQQLPPFEALVADAPRNLNFMEFKYNHGLDQGSASTVFDFIESKFGAVFGSSTAMGSNGFNGVGFVADGAHAAFGQVADAGDVKQGSRLLSLEWQEQQGCAELERDSFGYSNGIGLWAGMINGHHGSSAAI